jgi:hypothetical protein
VGTKDIWTHENRAVSLALYLLCDCLCLSGYSAGKTNRPGPVYSLIESGILRFYRYGLHKGIDYL